jgi:hypothetical protein
VLLFERLECRAFLEPLLCELLEFLHQCSNRVLELLLELGSLHILHRFISFDGLVEGLSEDATELIKHLIEALRLYFRLLLIGFLNLRHLSINYFFYVFSIQCFLLQLVK